MKELQDVFQRLHLTCEAQQWRGYDPYDALTSPLARLLPGKFARQAWTQLHKRSRVNLRPLCGIRPTLNAKALALFALGSRDRRFLELLRASRNPDGGWGYPFPWQSRAFYAPAGTSNLICTVFAARAFRALGEPLDVRAFIETKLLRDQAGERWISYIPQSATQVHNINMLGAAALGRRDCMEFSVNRQRSDGSWWYGEATNQHWIDNFHTGYCLEALQELGGFAAAAQRGFAYWDRTFWREDGAPIYYHDGSGPHDVHASAQGIVTYLAFDQPAKAERVAVWAVKNLWDERRRYFRHQPGNPICYLRWAQAWMYYALASLLRRQGWDGPAIL